MFILIAKGELNFRKQRKGEGGQSLVEVLVAMGIFVISITAALLMFFGGQSLSTDSINAQLALDYATEGLEATRVIRDRNWNELIDGAHGLVFQNNEWLFGSTTVNDTKGDFTRTIFITNIDANTKQASSTISWATDQRMQTVTLVALFTKWSSPVAGGCAAGPLSGNWTLPQVLGSADLGAGNSGTDIAVKLPYAFVSGTASSASKPDVFVFNASNPTSPSLTASLNIGSGGINALFLKNNYLYAASPNDTKEFIVFDITNPASMAEAASLNLSGTEDAISIYGTGDVIYIGRKESSGSELVVINVSNPLAPSVAASIETTDDVNDIFSAGDNLYLVSEESNNDIRIYDISNPLSPQQRVTYNLTQGGELVSVASDSRNNIITGDHTNELFILGATSTQLYVRSKVVVGDGVSDIACVENNLALIATANSTKEFMIINIANPDAISEYASLNLPQIGTGIDFADNKVFMSIRSNDALKIITSSP